MILEHPLPLMGEGVGEDGSGHTKASFPAKRPILLTTDAVGGVWRYTIDLAHALASRHVPVHLVTIGPRPSPALRAEARGLVLTEFDLPLSWTAPDPDALAETTTALRALVRNAAALHLHDPALAGSAPWPVPLVSVCHSCTATWWRAVRTGPLPEDLSWRADATRAGLDVSNAILAPTRAHAAAVTATYGDRAIEIVHNGSDFLPRPAPLRPERAVLTAGRLWDEGKGIAALDHIAPQLDAPIRAAGPTNGPNSAIAHLPNLQCLGPLDAAAMGAAYASAHVFASPARYEPFGLSVLEAARAGRRLVLSDIPTFRELWDGAATFVAHEADWLPTLRSALDTPGDGGARDRAARYTVDAMADGTLSAHRRVGVAV